MTTGTRVTVYAQIDDGEIEALGHAEADTEADMVDVLPRLFRALGDEFSENGAA